MTQMQGIGKIQGPSILTWISWSVRGLNNGRKCRHILSYLQRHSVDIACLQETHLPVSTNTKFAQSWGQHSFFANYCNCARGTAVIIHKRVPFKCHAVFNDNDGRYTIVSGQILDHDITIVSVYAPNTDSPEFFHNLHLRLTKVNHVSSILGGDLNLIIDSTLDSSKRSPSIKPRSLKAFGDLCEALLLTDRWRQCNPTTRSYTRYSGQHNTWTRIDYWWMRPDICMWFTSIDTPKNILRPFSSAPTYNCPQTSRL